MVKNAVAVTLYPKEQVVRQANAEVKRADETVPSKLAQTSNQRSTRLNPSLGSTVAQALTPDTGCSHINIYKWYAAPLLPQTVLLFRGSPTEFNHRAAIQSNLER